MDFFYHCKKYGVIKKDSLSWQYKNIFLFSYLQHCNWICFVGLFDRSDVTLIATKCRVMKLTMKRN
jgi:hypothetical protein